MAKRPRAQHLVIVPLAALTGAMKTVALPAPQPPLPKAATETAVESGTGTETGIEIGTGIETGTEIGIETETGTEIGNGTEIEIETGTETVTEIGTGTEIGIESETGTETERVLFAGRTHSLNAGPLGKGILSMCMEKK